MLRTKHWLSMQYYLRYKSSHRGDNFFFLFRLFIKWKNLLMQILWLVIDWVTKHIPSHGIHGNSFHTLSVCIECFLMPENSTVHRFKSTKKINNNIKSIQEGFQKFYMEEEKSERSYTWNMIYVTSQIVYSIQV